MRRTNQMRSRGKSCLVFFAACSLASSSFAALPGRLTEPRRVLTFAPLPDPVGVARSLPDLPEEVFQPACAVQGAADGKVAFFVFAEHGEKGVSGGWVGPLLARASFC